MLVTTMTPLERRAAASLALIFALRMLGLFMVLPVFALYGGELSGATPFLIGAAMGIYGLSQALLQIPFGMLSDRVGRKPVIATGLLIFAAGSVVAALADSIYWVIIGRALQGAGAIAAAVMALTADLTREEHRTKAMAMVGVSIGMSFLVAMVAGPLLGHWLGLSGIFWVTAVLALLGIVILFLLVPTATHTTFHPDAEVEPARFVQLLRNGELLRLDFGILVLHLVLTAMFVVLPLLLRDAGLESQQQWYFYLPVMVLAMGAMVPFIIIAERKRRMKPVFVGAVAVLLVASLGFYAFSASLWAMALLLFLFFAAFNLLEASLPSLISKTAPADAKGTAMGIYTSSQFIGAFLGGLLGGWIHNNIEDHSVFLACAALLLLWLPVALTMRTPRYLSPLLLRVGYKQPHEVEALQQAIAAVPGVREVMVHGDEGVAYLKVEHQALNEEQLSRFSLPEDDN